MTTPLYIPKGAIKPSESITNPMRIVIIGGPGSGKTTSVLTFPNIIYLDIDKKFGMHRHRDDISYFPFWDPDFVSKKLGYPTVVEENGFRMHDAVSLFIRDHGPKLSEEQTLVIDSATMLEASIDAYFGKNPPQSKGGRDTGFEEWKRRKTYWETFFNQLKQCKCGIVMIFHEQKLMDAEGVLTGGILPVLQGAMKQLIGAYFTDWFRQTYDKSLGYRWQIQKDADCACNTTNPYLNSLKDAKGDKLMHIKAEYKSLIPKPV